MYSPGTEGPRGINHVCTDAELYITDFYHMYIAMVMVAQGPGE